MKSITLRAVLALGLLACVVPTRGDDGEIKLTPIPVTDVFDAFVPSFGPYAAVDKVVEAEHWTGAIRVVCQEYVAYGKIGERRLAVLLYRAGDVSKDSSSRPAARLLCWREKEKIPVPQDLSGEDAIALLRQINSSEFFALAGGFNSRQLPPAPSKWEVLGEEFFNHKTVRVARDVETSAPARALVEALGCKIATK